MLGQGAAHIIRQFAAIDEEHGFAFAWHIGIGERQRRMRDIAATNVEKPRDIVRIRYQHAINAGRGEFGGGARDLRVRTVASLVERM